MASKRPEVRQLKNKLNSYVCEPKTYSLYERIESLKHRLENLSNANSEMLRTLKEKRKSVEEYVDSVRK
ncbi:MAG: hypothetical protein MUO53_05420 [Maribacter sp.]|nr:hypothetical protein [Maribacter sp.]